LSLSLDKYYGNVNNEIYKLPGCATTGVGERTQQNLKTNLLAPVYDSCLLAPVFIIEAFANFTCTGFHDSCDLTVYYNVGQPYCVCTSLITAHLSYNFEKIKTRQYPSLT